MVGSIKTGLLCIPRYDEEAARAVRRLLRHAMPGAVILADWHVESRRYLVEETLRRWCDEDELDLIFTIGGTMPAPGPGAHEIAPEATVAVIERAMPGLPEAMRAYAFEDTALALLDRSVAGIRGRTLIVNLPAGAVAAPLFLQAIVDVLAPAVAHLHEEADAPTVADALAPMQTSEDLEEAQPAAAPHPDGAGQSSSRTLDAAEFVEFLRRRSADA